MVPSNRGGQMTSWITVCDTCKQEGWEETESAQTDGERLADLVETAADGKAVKVRRFSCLMGCTRACNVTIQAPGKVNYTIGQFDADQASAEGIVDYALLHGGSETGVVPYRQWPQAIKGHFVSRHPPLPEDE